jgi:rSAM/selenodomain-associated transferase 2
LGSISTNVVSFIIPTYNEEECIGRTLASLAGLDGDFEVIVADGASTDGTVVCVRSFVAEYPHPLRVMVTEKHRARQLNSAAAVAQGEVLVFLHADTLVSPDALGALELVLKDSRTFGGNFDLIFEGNSFVERFFTWAYRVRRPLGIYYGDSGIFVRRRVFDRLGGFADIPIMDDYEFVRRLERLGRTACVPSSLKTSGRRWQVQGLFNTLASWVWVQALFSLGVPAERLAKWYKPVRELDAPAAPESTGYSAAPSAQACRE